MLKKIISAAAAVILFFCTGVYAAEINAEKNILNGHITVTAKTHSLDDVTVKIVNNKFPNEPVYLSYTTADKEGNAEYTFKLAESTVSGKYTVVLGSGYEQKPIASYTFDYVSFEEKNNIIKNEINKVKSREELDTALGNRKDKLDLYVPEGFGISEKGYKLIADNVYKKLPFENIGDFNDTYFSNMAAAVINETDEKKAAAEFFEEYLKLSEEPCYPLVQTLKGDIYSRFGNAESAEDIRKMYNETAVLCGIEQAEDYGTVMEILDRYKAAIPFSPEQYEKSNKSKTAMAIGGKRYGSMNELKQAIADACNSQSGGNTASPSGGGGGSSGGKTSQSVSIPPNILQIPKVAPYKDVDSENFAYEAILYLTEKKTVNGSGDGNFNPNDNITRAEFIKMAVLTFGLYDEESTADFNDVEKNSWAYTYIASAVKNGLAKGMGNGSFGADLNITREDMAVIIANAMEIKGETAEFKDETEISDYAKSAVGGLYINGIIKGYEDGRFMPKENAARAEAAVLIYNCIMYMEGASK